MATIFLVIFAILGVLTDVPNPAAHHISHLGYYSVCTPAPFSTATLFVLVVGYYVVFRKMASWVDRLCLRRKYLSKLTISHYMTISH